MYGKLSKDLAMCPFLDTHKTVTHLWANEHKWRNVGFADKITSFLAVNDSSADASEGTISFIKVQLHNSKFIVFLSFSKFFSPLCQLILFYRNHSLFFGGKCENKNRTECAEPYYGRFTCLRSV